MSGLSHAAEIDWIQGEWISDTDASVAANPEFQNLDPALKEAAVGMFGRMRWTISGGVLSSNRGDSDSEISETHSASFSIEQMEGEELRLLIVEDDGQTRMQLRRTDAGFCLRVSVWSDLYPQWHDGTIAECFRRVSF